MEFSGGEYGVVVLSCMPRGSTYCRTTLELYSLHPSVVTNFRYRPCVVCKFLMMVVNLAGTSDRACMKWTTALGVVVSMNVIKYRFP